jgi:hypothetical protein
MCSAGKDRHLYIASKAEPTSGPRASFGAYTASCLESMQRIQAFLVDAQCQPYQLRAANLNSLVSLRQWPLEGDPQASQDCSSDAEFHQLHEVQTKPLLNVRLQSIIFMTLDISAY